MTKIDIFSGFLGAGKTTLIKKLITEAYAGEKLVLIENEFGEIGIDGGFLSEAGIQINEMNSGCICCSLVGDFGKALSKVLTEYEPDRILIEPSGVGKLSDVIRAVQNAATEGAVLNSFTTVVDAGKCKMYMKNFGEFFNDQVANAGCIVLSHTDKLSEEKVADAVARLTAHNETAIFVTTPWDQLNGADLLAAMERKDTLEAELERLTEEAHHHHHHHEDGEKCHCHDHEHDQEHHHHHHEDDEAHKVGNQHIPALGHAIAPRRSVVYIKAFALLLCQEGTTSSCGIGGVLHGVIERSKVGSESFVLKTEDAFFLM